MNGLRTDNSGFVVLELLTVVAILAILFSIATPRYMRYLKTAEAASCLSNRRNIEIAAMAARATAGGVPAASEYTLGNEQPWSPGGFLARLVTTCLPWHVESAWAIKPAVKPQKPDKKQKTESLDKPDSTIPTAAAGEALPEIDAQWQCPSGGIYLWLVVDPADPDYPKAGCSAHYAALKE